VSSATWRAGPWPRWKRMRQVDAREIPTTVAPNRARRGASRWCSPVGIWRRGSGRSRPGPAPPGARPAPAARPDPQAGVGRDQLPGPSAVVQAEVAHGPPGGSAMPGDGVGLHRLQHRERRLLLGPGDQAGLVHQPARYWRPLWHLDPVRPLSNTLQRTKSSTIAGAQHQDQPRSTQPGVRLSRERNGGDRELVDALQSRNNDSLDGPTPS